MTPSQEATTNGLQVHNLDLDIDNLTSSKGDNLPPLRDPATIESHTIQDLIELSNLK